MCITELYLQKNYLKKLFQKKMKKFRRSRNFFIFFWNTVGTRIYFQDFYKGNSDFEISEVINRGRIRKDFFKELLLFSKSQNLRFFFFFQISDFRILISESRIRDPDFRISDFLKISESEILRLQDMQLLCTPLDYLLLSVAKYDCKQHIPFLKHHKHT